MGQIPRKRRHGIREKSDIRPQKNSSRPRFRFPVREVLDRWL